MDLLRFWLSCFQWAFWRWERGESYMTLSLNATAWLLPILGAASFIKSGPVWLTLAPIAILVMLVVLIAPYQLWKRESGRANKAENKLKPRISAVGLIVGEEDDIGRESIACVRVTNLGSEPIRNCTGYLKAVFKNYDGRLEKDNYTPSLYFPWSRRHDSKGNRELTFNGEADLDIVIFTRTFSGGPRLATLSDEKPSNWYWLEEPSYVYDIEIAAENCGPVRQMYQLTTHPIMFEVFNGSFEPPTFDMEGSQN
jgi:hypothetical protein